MENEKLGKAITYLRKKAGYTQQQLSSLLDISDKAVSKWERGLSCPDISLLAKLSVLLGTDIESLLEGNVSYHKHMWKGILIIKDDADEISVSRQIYDKPMVYYLLSYFLLVGIREIMIICSLKEKEQMEQIIGDGGYFGVQIFYCICNQNSVINNLLVNQKSFFENYNIMVVYGKKLLYGIDLTKYFQRAMARQHGITFLVTQNKYGEETKKIIYDTRMMVVSDDSNIQKNLQEAYCSIPILFCGTEVFNETVSKKEVDISIDDLLGRNEEIYVEMIGRGMVEFSLKDEEDIVDASMFVRAVQRQQGEYVACLEEIAWRRGLISKKEFKSLGEKRAGTMYGEYIKRLYKEC